MATARKLPSGSWRVRVYSFTDSKGVKHYESFTASTKAQAEQMASRFKTRKSRADDLTVKEAVERYLEVNDAVLSPSTLAGYRKSAKRFETINHLRLRKISSEDLQRFVSELSKDGLSPKTVKNIYGLLHTILTFFGVETKFTVHLPKSQKRRVFAPENAQIMALYEAAPRKMKIAISLAAFHSLRRGEISAIKYRDIQGNVLYVHSDIVRGVDGWVHKEIPKTETSNRNIYLTDLELQLIGSGNPDDYVVGLLPSSIGTNFFNIRKRVGLEHIRFHDLRVYFASISVAMGMSETTLAHLGGWREGSQVLRDHYKKSIQSIDQGYAQKINKYFETMTQDMSRQKKNG